MFSPITKKDVESGKFDDIVYAVSNMQGWRTEQEDEHLIKHSFPVRASGIFGVFDGHGGTYAAKFLRNNLIKTMKKLLHGKTSLAMSSESFLGDLLTESFLEVDRSIFETAQTNADKNSGTTACVCIYNENRFVTGWTGDSRVVLCRKGKAVPLTTQDHKPDIKSERKRIEENGGTVTNGRVNGILAVSRALGDYNFKDTTKQPRHFLVSAVPEIFEKDRNDIEDEFLLLACDGIWDVMSNQQACTFVRNKLRRKIKGTRDEINVTDVESVVNQLLDQCLNLGSKDNMTAMLIVFQHSVSLRRKGRNASSVACNIL
eukprot:g1868.t1